MTTFSAIWALLRCFDECLRDGLEMRWWAFSTASIIGVFGSWLMYSAARKFWYKEASRVRSSLVGLLLGGATFAMFCATYAPIPAALIITHWELSVTHDIPWHCALFSQAHDMVAVDSTDLGKTPRPVLSHPRNGGASVMVVTAEDRAQISRLYTTECVNHLRLHHPLLAVLYSLDLSVFEGQLDSTISSRLLPAGDSGVRSCDIIEMSAKAMADMMRSQPERITLAARSLVLIFSVLCLLVLVLFVRWRELENLESSRKSSMFDGSKICGR